MTNEKYLELVNKAIENLKDNDDNYGQTPIDFMRKTGLSQLIICTYSLTV